MNTNDDLSLIKAFHERELKGYRNALNGPEVKELVEALGKAYHELNIIHARSGVPYDDCGAKSCVSPDYFSSVVEECREALAKFKEVCKS